MDWLIVVLTLLGVDVFGFVLSIINTLVGVAT